MKRYDWIKGQRVWVYQGDRCLGEVTIIDVSPGYFWARVRVPAYGRLRFDGRGRVLTSQKREGLELEGLRIEPVERAVQEAAKERNLP